MWLGWIPAGLVFVIVANLIVPKSFLVLLFFAFFVSWSAIWLTAWMRWSKFTCPNCGERFFHKKLQTPGPIAAWRAILGHQCMNCGIHEPQSKVTR